MANVPTSPGRERLDRLMAPLVKQREAEKKAEAQQQSRQQAVRQRATQDEARRARLRNTLRTRFAAPPATITDQPPTLQQRVATLRPDQGRVPLRPLSERPDTGIIQGPEDIPDLSRGLTAQLPEAARPRRSSRASRALEGRLQQEQQQLAANQQRAAELRAEAARLRAEPRQGGAADRPNLPDPQIGMLENEALNLERLGSRRPGELGALQAFQENVVEPGAGVLVEGIQRAIPGEQEIQRRTRELREQGVGPIEARRLALLASDLPATQIDVTPGFSIPLPGGRRFDEVDVGLKGAALIAADPANLAPFVGFPGGIARAGLFGARTLAAVSQLGARASRAGLVQAVRAGDDAVRMLGNRVARVVADESGAVLGGSKDDGLRQLDSELAAANRSLAQLRNSGAPVSDELIDWREGLVALRRGQLETTLDDVQIARLGDLDVDVPQLRASIEAEDLAVREHPAFPFRSLVQGSGKGRGELRDEAFTRLRFRQNFDGIAQELGYDRGEVTSIGQRFGHEVGPTERFKADLRDIFESQQRLTGQRRQLRSIEDEWKELNQGSVGLAGADEVDAVLPGPARPARTAAPTAPTPAQSAATQTAGDVPASPVAAVGQGAAPPSAPPPGGVVSDPLPNPPPSSAGNTFAAPLLSFDEVMEGVSAPDNPFLRALVGRTGINPSALQNSPMGRAIVAYQRQRVAAESLTNAALSASVDVHAQRFTGVVRRPSGPLGAVVRGPLDIDAKGVVRGTSKRWEDVFSNPTAYDLKPEARAFIDDLLRVVDEVEQLRVDAGLEPRATRSKDGWLYVPRQATETRGVALQRPSNPDLQRVFEEATDGAAAGVKYSNDPRANLRVHLLAAYREIADKQLSDAIEPQGVSAADLVPVAVRSRLSGALARREAARAEVKRLRVPRVNRRGPAPDEEKALRASLRSASAEATAEMKAADVAYTEARSAFDGALARAERSEVATGALFGKTDDAISVRQWRSRFFPTEDTKLLRKGVEDFFGPAPAVLRPVQQVANTVRLMAAGVLDLAAPMIQGLPLLTENPAAWARMVTRHTQAFFDPTAQARVVRDHLETFQKMAQNGVGVGNDEFFAAMRSGGGIPVGAPLEFLPKGAEARELLRLGGKQSFGRFQSSYDTGLAMSRALLWEGAEGLPRFADNPGELAAWVRNLTGALDSRALGVGPTQRALESVLLGFSPRYMRSTFSWFADALRPTSPRRLQALESMGRTMAGVAMLYATTGLALGKSWDEIETGLNPLSGKRFLSHQVNGDWIGVGGQVRAITSFMAQMYSALAPGGKPISDLASANQFDNPILGFYTSRGAPALNIGGALVEAGTGGKVDALPFDTIDSLPDLAKHLGTAVLPFTLQGLLEGEQALTAAFAFAGFRTSPQTASEARNELRAQAMRDAGQLGAEEPYSREKWAALGIDKKAPILALPAVKEAQDRVDEQRRVNRDQWIEYLDARQVIDDEIDVKIEAAAEAGPSLAFRLDWMRLKHNASERKDEVRRANEDLLATFEDTEPNALFDQALDAFFAAITSPDIRDDTGAVDFTKRDALLRQYRLEFGDTLADQVEEHLRSKEHPLAQQLLEDLDVLRPYWAIGDGFAEEFKLSETTALAWQTHEAQRTPALEKRRLRDEFGLQLLVNEQRDRRLDLRAREFETVDAALARWYDRIPLDQQAGFVRASAAPASVSGVTEDRASRLRQTLRERFAVGAR